MERASREQFIESAKQKKILGAYLVVCQRSEIASRLVNEFLFALYCKRGGCGYCAACKKVREGHIDIMRLSVPKVDEIRDAISFVNQKAADSAFKTVVVYGADDMNASASNSLLKTLEEPPQGSVIILAARSAAGVLPTISSRCAIIHIPTDENAKAKIMKALRVDETRAHILANLSGGFVDEAASINEDKNKLELRSRALEMCNKILTQDNYAISAHADYLESNKDDIIFLLSVMQSFFHDISMFQKTKAAELIANIDYSKRIQNYADSFTTGAISNIIKVILEAERRFSLAVNFRLAAEKMLFDILEEKNRWLK